MQKLLGIYPSLKLRQYHVLWYGKTSTGAPPVGTYRGDEPNVASTLSLSEDHSFVQTLSRDGVTKEVIGRWSQDSSGTVRFSNHFLKSKREVEDGGKDAVLSDVVGRGQSEIDGLKLVNVLGGIAGEDGTALPEGLVGPEVVLVRADVATAGAQIVVTPAGDVSLQRLISSNMGFWKEAEEGDRAWIQCRQSGVGIEAAGKWILESGCLAREVAGLHTGCWHKRLDDTGLWEAKTLVGGKEECLVAAVVEMRERIGPPAEMPKSFATFFGLLAALVL